MKLAAFEEMVLLIVGMLGDEAYGVSIKEALHDKLGKSPSIGALHSALYRLESKGYVVSEEGGATTERGGRRKKFYRITAYGMHAIEEVNEMRLKIARQIPGLKLGFK